MSGRTTKPYRNTLSGSIGAGMGSLFAPGGKKYYILEHKVTSKYHRAGESQEIIVDNIELGRDPLCQVRFDESFKTVSRHHAAIVREGDMWKLVQISKTNSTFLNGRPVKTEWYLQNGDEIQLSVNGPKLGFIVPTGNKSTVGSIGLTRRLSLFRQQALRPYKRAITALSCFLVLGIGIFSYVYWNQQGTITNLNKSHLETLAKLDKMKEQNASLKAIVDNMDEYIRKQDSIINVNKRRINALSNSVSPSANVANLISQVRSSVFYIQTTVYMKIDDSVQRVSSSSGTGFLLADGRFVTARHCVESWLFAAPRENILNETYDNVTVWSEISAFGVDSNNDFKLKSTDFKIDRSKDVIVSVGKDEYGNEQKMRLAHFIESRDPKTGEVETFGTRDMGGTDWAVAMTNKKGGIEVNPSLSVSLKAGTEVHVLGFPAGLGAGDGKNRIEPIYNKMSVARDGINKEGCIMVSQGVAHGNSGGPVFAIQNNKIYAVAIVSKLEIATQRLNSSGTAITQQQQQYDQLVPINNIK